jgi:hypothetical protein
MKRRTIQTLAIAAVVALGAAVAVVPRSRACPFCNAAMQTLSQEIEGADVALIAELAQPMPTSSEGASPDAAAAKFRVIQVIRGADRLAGAKEINVVYFGEEAPDKKFMITGLAGVTGPGLDWTTPVPLSERAVGYIKHLPTVPATGADRLAFFQDYLEDDDALLAQDAYDEFARMPYDAVTDLGPRMNRQQLLKWIDSGKVGPSGRRLYLTMLSICGQPEDVGMLEKLMHYDYAAMKPAIAAVVATSGLMGPSAGVGLIDEMLHAEERRKRESLDALIACYLKLKGPDGLELINQLFLRNPNVEYKHLMSTLTALRFHGEQTNVLPREKLLESMRLVLDHNELADQVIADLTRWEDWEVMPRLVSMFKESTKDDWIRLAVVPYLLVAADVPGDVGQQATAAIAELEKLDPESVKRARSQANFAFLARASASPAATPSDGSASATASVGAAPPATGAASDAGSAHANPAPVVAAAPAADPPVAGVPETPAEPTDEIASARPTPRAAAAPPIAAATVAPTSRIKIIGVPLLAAAVLLAIFAVLLRGADPRSSNENP